MATVEADISYPKLEETIKTTLIIGDFTPNAKYKKEVLQTAFCNKIKMFDEKMFMNRNVEDIIDPKIGGYYLNMSNSSVRIWIGKNLSKLRGTVNLVAITRSAKPYWLLGVQAYCDRIIRRRDLKYIQVSDSYGTLNSFVHLSRPKPLWKTILCAIGRIFRSKQ